MSWRRMAGWAACAAVACGAAVVTGCSDGAPATPSRSSYSVYLQYQAPAPGTIPPGGIDDAMCYHHYAPSNLSVSTSWVFQGRFAQADTDVYGLLLQDVPVNQDVWVSFLDVTLCPTGRIYVTRGVTANGTALARVQVVDGRSALAFRLDGRGTVIP